MVDVQRAGNISDALSGSMALADIRVAQGRLREALRTYERALQLAPEPGQSVLRGTADLYVGLSELAYERNDLAGATQHLLRSKELGEQIGLPQNQSRWCVAMARIRAARGDINSALDLLHTAERLYVPDLFPNLRPVAALIARLWVAQGRSGEALAWAREQGLSATDPLNYLREFEHITLSRALLARYKRERTERSLQEVMEFLERLLQAAHRGERRGSVLELLLLQALAHQAQGDLTAALIPLRQALSLAEPEGYVRLFVDEGPSMMLLLEEAARHRLAPDYVRHLLAAMGKADDRTPTAQILSEPLSPRELEVLQLLRSELDGPEIADKLVVSPNTLRTHTKKIYSKLGVSNRRAALRRAEELYLF
jgi:LuxR family maltose regulon positive regulatory protein